MKTYLHVNQKPDAFNRRNHPQRQRGQALIPVIFITAILTTVAVALSLNAADQVHSSANFSTQARRFYAVKGALAYAMSALAQTSNNGATYGIIPAGPDTDDRGWMQVGDSWVKIDSIDTGALINLNTADAATLERIPVFQSNTDLVAAMMDWRTAGDQASTNGAKSDYYETLNPPYDSKNAPYDSIEELLLVKGMTPSILFGSPAGSTVTPAGDNPDSTSGGLGTVSPATRAASRQAAGPTTRPGATGTGAAAGGAAGSATGATGTGTTGTGAAGAATAVGDTDWTDIYNNSTLPLSELFTTLARERNVAADGTPRVNINTATAQDLQTKLGITQALATSLVNFRSSGPNGAAGGAGGGQRQGVGANGQAGGAGAPTARAASRRTRQAAGVGVGIGTGAAGGGAAGTGTGAGGGTGTAAGGAGGAGTQVFKSIADLMNIPGRTIFDRTIMQSIADYVTVDDNPYHTNLVNINTAPQEVLASVPGIDHATVQAIIDYRQNGANPFQSLGDLFTITSLTRQQYINVIAHLCTKSAVYRVRIKVSTSARQSIYAIEALIEMTDAGPRVRTWHEVPYDPGWRYWTPSPTLPTPAPVTAPGDNGDPVTTGTAT